MSTMETCENLFYTELAPSSVYLQLADQSVCYVEGISLDLLVKVRDSYVPADFVILNMGISKVAPIILGYPFLNTTNACIYVASRCIQFHLDGKKETFAFASGKPIFYEKQEWKKQSKKRRTRKPKSIEEKEVLTPKFGNFITNGSLWKKADDLNNIESKTEKIIYITVAKYESLFNIWQGATHKMHHVRLAGWRCSCM